MPCGSKKGNKGSKGTKKPRKGFSTAEHRRKNMNLTRTVEVELTEKEINGLLAGNDIHATSFGKSCAVEFITRSAPAFNAQNSIVFLNQAILEEACDSGEGDHYQPGFTLIVRLIM